MTQTPAEQAQVVLNLIRKGKLDDYMDMINETIITRRRTLAIRQMAEVGVGDTVTIIDKIRPQLLAGRKAKVLEVTRAMVKVRLFDDINPKWNSRTIVRLRPTHIGSVEKFQVAIMDGNDNIIRMV